MASKCTRSAEVATPVFRVDGVEYSESDLLPGQTMFACSRMSATLRVASCVTMWRQANQGQVVERLMRCRGCSVGACHAGIADPGGHRLKGTQVCSRCHSGSLRLIGGNICVSCKNREYEWVKGRNAKGKFPTQHPPMHRLRLAFWSEGRAQVLVRERAVSRTELVVELLRDSASKVLMGLGRLEVVGV